LLEKSPSALRTEEARAHVERRKELLIEKARQATLATSEPPSPSAYRIKRRRKNKEAT